MNTIDHISVELKEIAPAVANLQKHHLYTVPNAYFTHLSDEILNLVKQDELFSNAKHNPYITPNGYFTDLHEKIAAKTFEQIQSSNEFIDELNEVAPLLNTLNKNNVYELPSDYFVKEILPKSNNVSAKIVSFSNARKWINYAVAAVIMGIVGIGAVRYIGVKNTHFVLEKEVTKATDEEITSYLETQPHTDASNVSIINEEHGAAGLFEGTTTDEINQYLNEQPETAESLNKGI